jgi:hypothetical protein
LAQPVLGIPVVGVGLATVDVRDGRTYEEKGVRIFTIRTP